MLNLNPNDAVRYTPSQARAIDTLIANRGNRTGKELWDDKGTNDEFVVIKKTIMRHSLNIQRVRCVFCETLLEYGGVAAFHNTLKIQPALPLNPIRTINSNMYIPI